MTNKRYLILEKKWYLLYCGKYKNKDFEEDELIFFLARGNDEAKVILEEYFDMTIEEAKKEIGLEFHEIDGWFRFAGYLEKGFPAITYISKEENAESKKD